MRRFTAMAKPKIDSFSQMKDVFASIERFWNYNDVLAFGLVFLGICACFWAAHTSHSVGVAIALLAGMAGIMSVRPEMGILEKLAWVILLVSFTVLEVIAINHQDEVNAANLAVQASAIRDIGNTAQRNLLAITGGDSYVYAVPIATTTQSKTPFLG